MQNIQEDLKVTIERRFLDKTNTWSVAVRCEDQGYSVWTGGCFNKDMKKAEQEALNQFKQSIAFQRELRKPSEIEQLKITV